jgi:hypothetical protein
MLSDEFITAVKAFTKIIYLYDCIKNTKALLASSYKFSASTLSSLAPSNLAPRPVKWGGEENPMLELNYSRIGS